MNAPSPFASAAPALVKQGYSALPIMPGDKIPGQRSADGTWRPMKGWSDYCSAPTPPNLVKAASTWPGAGIGVACGRGLVCVDIDRDDVRAAVESVLPPGAPVRRGAKGVALFFRGDTDKITSASFNGAGGGRLVDLLAAGRQSVLPPTIHPDTGKPYVWLSGSLEKIPLADLPELPDDVAERLGRALAPFGYNPAAYDGAGAATAPCASEGRTTGASFSRELNDAALASIASWAPALGLPKGRMKGGVYVGVAHWRPSSTGRSLSRRAPNLRIHPKGIVDEGTGDGLTPLNLVMAALGLGFDGAVAWLEQRLGRDPGPDMHIKGRASAEVDDEPCDDGPPPLTLESTLEDLTRPPGLVGAIVDWCEATADRPSRAAALGAALGFVATLAGRRFASASDARTNLYLVTLAESGYGKDHARQAVKRLATEAGLAAALGPGRVMSTTALRNKLLQRPALLLMCDEFHGTMAMVTDTRSPYARLLADDLLELFASASTFFAGAEYASTPAVDIHNPNLSLYGTTTPDAFWTAVGGASVTNGLLARFILLNIATAKPAWREPSADLRRVPPALIEAAKALAKAGTGDISPDGTRPQTARTVPYTPDAVRVLNTFRGEVEGREGHADGRQKPFLNRAVEHAIKLALTVAVGVDPPRPEITGEVMAWACRLAWHSVVSMMIETRDRVADGKREAAFNRILGIIKAAPGGCKPSAIGDGARGVDKRMREEILADLQAAGRVRFGPVKTGNGQRDRWMYVR